MILAELVPNGINEFFQWKGVLFKGTVFQMNKTTFLLLLASLICIVFFAAGSRRKALVPSGVQNVAEAGYEIVDRSIAQEVMGPEGKAWTPFLATLFFWIFFANLWEVIPGVQFPPTSRIAVPMYLAVQTWVIFIVVGFVKQGPLYLVRNITPPGVPKVLYVLVIPIELISKYLIRPFSLAVRLFANMVAGHVLLTVFAIMCVELAKHDSGWYQLAIVPLPFFMLTAMTAFELLVALLQAYIFTILTAVYISESMHPEH